MGYEKKDGELALLVLKTKLQNGLSYFEKREGEDFFIRDFTSLYDAYLAASGIICRGQIRHFGKELAQEVYGSVREVQGIHPFPHKDCFFWMCFVYLTCLCRKHPFDIGERNVTASLRECESLGVSEEEYIRFWSEVSALVWQTRREAPRKAVRHVA